MSVHEVVQWVVRAKMADIHPDHSTGGRGKDILKHKEASMTSRATVATEDSCVMVADLCRQAQKF